MAASKIVVELELKDNEFHVRTIRAGEAVRTLSKRLDETYNSIKRIDKGVTGFLPRLRDFAITASVLKGAIHNVYNATFGWQMAIINTNAEIERMTFLLRGMSNATDAAARGAEAAQNVEDLFTMAQNAPFSINELTNSFVKMKSVGIDPLDGSMKALTDAVAAFGGNDQILHRASIAIQQMAGKGVISMEELRQQLGEAVPRAIHLMARSLNMTVRQLVDAISKGNVEASGALRRMFREFDRTLGGAGERMMQTWTGMMNVIRTQWIKLQKDVGDAGLFQQFKDFAREISDALASPEAREMAYDLGQALLEIAKNIADVVRWFVQWRREIWTTMQVIGAFWLSWRAARILVDVTRSLNAFRLSMIALGHSLHTSTLPALEDYTRKTKLAAFATGVMTRGVGVLSIALRAINPVIAIVTTLLSAGASAWLLWGDEGEAAINRVSKGIVSLETLKQAQKELATLDAQIRSLQAQKELFEKHGNTMTAALASMEWTPEKEQQLAALLSRREAAHRQIMAAEERLRKEAEDQFVRQQLRLSETQINALQAAYDARIKAEEELFRQGQITQKQFKEARAQAIRDFYQGQIVIHEEEAAKLQQRLKIEHDLGEEEKRNITAAYEARRKLVKEALQKMNTEIKEVFDPTPIVGEGKNKDIDRFMQMVDRAKASIAEFRAEMDGGSSTFAKWDSLVRSGYFGEAMKKDWEKMRGEMKKVADEFDETEKKLREHQRTLREQEQAMERLAQAERQLAVDHEAALVELQSDGAINQNSLVIRTKKLVDELLQKLPMAGEGADELRRRLNDLVSRAAQVQSLEAVNALRQRTRELQISLLNEREQIDANYRLDVQRAIETTRVWELSGEARMKAEEDLYRYLDALRKRYVRDTEHPLQRLARAWEQETERMKEASADWLDDFSNRFVEFVRTGQFEFRQFAESIIGDILRIRFQKMLAGIVNYVFSGVPTIEAGYENMGYGYAKGGIMTDKGPLPLHTYARGGIARTPQVAIFGEGRMPEAYVPLPDGRRIPVAMEGGGVGNVVVNVINQTGQPVEAEQRGPVRQEGEKMVLDVVLRNLMRPGPFRDGVRGALR